jgi:hypothetical protein
MTKSPNDKKQIETTKLIMARLAAMPHKPHKMASKKSIAAKKGRKAK